MRSTPSNRTNEKGTPTQEISTADLGGVAVEVVAPDQQPAPPVVRATGLRTPQGKNNSKYNPVKHGIFANVVLDGPGGCESRSEFRRLHEGLRENLNPEGALEEILVEKLAMILWRHARLVRAEVAEIRKGMEFSEWDQMNQQRQQAEAIDPTSYEIEHEGGLMRKIGNPIMLEKCLALLIDLRGQIAERGFDREENVQILQQLYGEFEDRAHQALIKLYHTWRCTAEAPEEERNREGYATPEQCTKKFLQELDGEMRRLKQYQKQQAAIGAARTQLEAMRGMIPDGPGMDRLLRYEASLERGFDRTLSQLERLQRLRAGLTVPPPLKVELSS